MRIYLEYDSSLFELGGKLRKVKGFAAIPIIFIVDKLEPNMVSSPENSQVFDEYLLKTFTPNELMIAIQFNYLRLLVILNFIFMIFLCIDFIKFKDFFINFFIKN